MNREILRLAIPNILSNISVPLLSTVDTLLMGDVSASHLGAIGLGGMIFNFLYWNFGFLRMGTTGMTAQAFGANDQKELSNLLYRVCIVGIGLSLIMMTFSAPIGDLLMTALQVQPNQAPLVLEYYQVRIWDAPATLLLYGLLGWFFGMQDSVSPLIITVIVNVTNILLSIYLVKTLDLGIYGVAMGTVFAQYLGVVLALALILYKYRKQVKFHANNILNPEKLLRFFKVNRDIFLRTLCLSTAFFFFYSQSSVNGEAILAVSVIIQQFLNWMSYGIDGIAYAAESLVGKAVGTKNKTQTHQMIKRVLLWGMVLAGLYSVVYAVWYDQLVIIFNSSSELLSLAQEYYWWAVIFPIIGSLCYIWDGIFVGLTASKSMRNTMFVALILYLGTYYLTKGIFGSHAIWFALAVFLGARGILMSLLYRKRGLELS